MNTKETDNALENYYSDEQKAKDLLNFTLPCEEIINLNTSDGMYESSITVDNEFGELVIKFRDDISDINSTVQTIKIHPSDFVDFLQMLNDAEKIYQDNKCFFVSNLCNKDFNCENCWTYKLEMEDY